MTAPDRPRVDFGHLTRGQQDRLVGLQVLVVGGVPDLVVALTRRARGRRGVQAGPALVSTALAVALPPAGRWALRRCARPDGRLDGRAVAAALVGSGAAAVLGPLAAAGSPRTVVGDGNPLWSVAWSAALRAVTSLVTILQVVHTLPAARERLSGG